MVINKAAKRVDILRALKHKLKRTTLKIYFAFVRPIFEYGCVVWYNTPRHDFLFNEVERFQLQAPRIITGTNNYASQRLLYMDTGWANYLNDVNIIFCFYLITYYTACIYIILY